MIKKKNKPSSTTDASIATSESASELAGASRLHQLISSFTRFSEFVAEGGDDACWYWRGAVNKGGYGVFRLGTRVVLAHRHMFELEHGRSPAGMLLHTCGKKSCVNPRHLYEATKPRPHDADASLLEKIDRAVLPPASPLRGASGVNNPRAQLTEDQVRSICVSLDRGVSPRAIALGFGVDAKSIRNIDLGKTWGHMPEVAQRADMPRTRRRRGWRRYGR